MKSLNKTKTPSKQKRSIKSKNASLKVFMVHDKKSKLRHFRLVEHKHTGKLLHHSHTSHLSLAIILAITGLLIFVNNDIAKAETATGSVTIGALVKGPPPERGAQITSPTVDQKFYDVTSIDVSGTCEPNTFVVVKDFSLAVGSTTCNSVGTFNLAIQPFFGSNILSAMNYDNYNQPGPETTSVAFSVEKTDEEVPVVAPAVPVAPVVPVTPENPSIIPGVPLEPTSCRDYKAGELPASEEPHVSVVCVPRIFGPGIEQVMGILVWGGTPPYAISTNWGNDKIEDTLLSIMSPGYKVVPFEYNAPGVYKISVKLKDSVGEVAIVQTSVQVSGTPTVPISNTIEEIVKKSWLVEPTPMYFLAVAITLGFWIGDLFDRKFGKGAPKHYYSRKVKATA